MAPREPTRAQLSSRLAYQQNTPSFLLKLQNRMNGIPDKEDDDDEEFEHVGGGREPIPKRPRPAIPERPEDDPGSADEDEGDEKPQVVVLKAGKHLTEWEAENVRRAEKGLPPLSDPNAEKALDRKEDKLKEPSSSTSTTKAQGLTFSSSSKAGSKGNKRKAVGMLDDIKFSETSKDKTKNPSKKPKKEKKTLLSFGDDT